MVAEYKDGVSHYSEMFTLSNSGDLLAIQGWYSHVIQIWDMRSGSIVNTLTAYEPGWKKKVMLFSPDDKYLITGSYRESLFNVWELESEKLVRTIGLENQNRGRANEAAFLNGGTIGIVNSSSIDILSFPEGDLLMTLMPDRETRSFVDADFSVTGNLVAASTYGDNDIFIWETNSGELIWTIEQEDGVYSGNNYYADMPRLSFSNDGGFLAASIKGKINIWSVQDRQIIATFQVQHFEEATMDIQFSPDNETLLITTFVQGSLTTDRTFLWNFRANQSTVLRDWYDGEFDNFKKLFSVNGDLIFSSGGGTSLRIFGQLVDEQEIEVIEIPDEEIYDGPLEFELPFRESFEGDEINAVDFSAGVWEMGTEDGKSYLKGIATENRPAAFWIGDYEEQDWEDYSLEVTFRLISGRLWTSVRDTGNDSYELFLSSEHDYIALQEYDYDYSREWEGPAELERASNPIRENSWHKLRFDVQGEELRIFIDDVFVLGGKSDTISEGTAQLILRTVGENVTAEVHIDEIAILPIDNNTLLENEEKPDENWLDLFQIVNGNWRYEREDGKRYLAGLGAEHEITELVLDRNSAWEDYIFEANVRAVGGPFSIEARSNFRYPSSDPDSTYSTEVFYSAQDGSIELRNWDDGQWDFVEEQFFRFESDTWYQLRFELNGLDANLYIDNTLILSGTSERIRQGIIRILIGTRDWYAKGEIHLSDISVTPLN